VASLTLSQSLSGIRSAAPRMLWEPLASTLLRLGESGERSPRPTPVRTSSNRSSWCRTGGSRDSENQLLKPLRFGPRARPQNARAFFEAPPPRGTMLPRRERWTQTSRFFSTSTGPNLEIGEPGRVGSATGAVSTASPNHHARENLSSSQNSRNGRGDPISVCAPPRS